MRIGIFDPYLDTLGGGEKYMLTAASCLSFKNQVYVFWDNDNILQLAQKKFKINLSKVKTTENIFNSEKSLLYRFLESRKFDAIFFLSDGSLPLVACSLYIHFQFPVEWVNTNRFMEKIKIKRIKKVICNSYFTKELIDKKFNVKSLVIYPPTYQKKEFPNLQFDNKKNIILNVGRYAKLSNGSSFKKQEFIINSFKKMVDNGLVNWQLHLVLSFLEKDKNFTKEIKKLANDYPIKILENILYQDLLKEYSEAKIYWHASGFGENLHSHPEKAEHFGITTVEAMANGLVPVVINAGGQKEIVEENKSGFLWNNEGQLLSKTLSIIKDAGKLKELAKEATDRSKTFSTDAFCTNIVRAFIK